MFAFRYQQITRCLPFFCAFVSHRDDKGKCVFFVRCLLFLEIGLKFVIREGRVSVRGMKP